MQKAARVTLWLGFWLGAASLASEPMKNCPAGMSTMFAGQLAADAALALGGAGIAATALASDVVATVSAAGVCPLPWPKTKNAPAPSAAMAARPPMIVPVLRFGVAVCVESVEGELVVCIALPGTP